MDAAPGDLGQELAVTIERVKQELNGMLDSEWFVDAFLQLACPDEDDVPSQMATSEFIVEERERLLGPIEQELQERLETALREKQQVLALRLGRLFDQIWRPTELQEALTKRAKRIRSGYRFHSIEFGTLRPLAIWLDQMRSGLESCRLLSMHAKLRGLVRARQGRERRTAVQAVLSEVDHALLTQERDAGPRQPCDDDRWVVEGKQLFHCGKVIELTGREQELVHAVLKARGLMSNMDVARRIWSNRFAKGWNADEANQKVRRLRSQLNVKLRDSGIPPSMYILTKRGFAHVHHGPLT